MLLTGNLLCRRICKTLSRVCKVSACKIFCMIQCYSLNSCDGPHGAAADKLPAGQLSAPQPSQLKHQLESVLRFITARHDLLEEKNHNDCVFPVLGVSVVFVRSGMPAQPVPAHCPAWQIPYRPLREAGRAE